MYNGLSFQLDKEYIGEQRKKSCPDNGNSIQKLVMMRTYSRNKFNNDEFLGIETYHEIIQRVVNGAFSILKDRLTELGTWEQYEDQMTAKAKEFYQLVFNFKITPPGRGFWAMGTELVNKEKLSFPLVNCTYISSKRIAIEGSNFFRFIMDVLMLGVGAGFGDEGAGTIDIKAPISNTNPEQIKENVAKSGDILRQHIKMLSESSVRDNGGIEYIQRELYYIDSNIETADIHVIKDSREGWVDAVGTLIDSYFHHKGVKKTIFDYSHIRPKGVPLKKFGGTASGPTPLCQGISMIRLICEAMVGKAIDSVMIADICNIIATVVVAGNVRRSSEIFISDNIEAIQFKNWENEKYKYRSNWMWASNNSFKITKEMMEANQTDGLYGLKLEKFEKSKVMSFEEVAKKLVPGICFNGEPGVFNLHNARTLGRACDGRSPYNDPDVDGTNPCGEIPLQGCHESGSSEQYMAGGETCNLVETFPSNYDMELEDMVEQYTADLWFAVLYAKLVTIIPPHWNSTAEIQNKNRRIGISQTGLAEFLSMHGIDINRDEGYKLFASLEDGWYRAIRSYDREISKMLDIPESIKVTTIKPSGTTSICGGINSSGMHCPISNYYIRRVRMSDTKKGFIDVLKKKGYKVEPVYGQLNTVVVEFPCKTITPDTRTRSDLSIEYQFRLAALLQTYWADNQVSCTITFTDEEADKIAPLLVKYKNIIKGISFLKLDTTAYPQIPEEAISEEKYNEICKNVQPLEYNDFIVDTYVEEEELDNYCSGDKCVRPIKQVDQLNVD